MRQPLPFVAQPHTLSGSTLLGAAVLIRPAEHSCRNLLLPPQNRRRRSLALILLAGLWLAIFFASLFSPPLLDDADATHANAARSMLLTGDWVTLHVNGIRYLEKAPLPYWLVALSFRLFGLNTFAAHLPQAVAVLLLALLGYRWGCRAFGYRTALYTAVAVLTSAGVFLFTRILIPEVWLSLFLALSLYSFLRTVSDPPLTALRQTLHSYLIWTSLALAVLSKGLVALVFFFGAALAFLALTRDWRHTMRLKPISGAILFLAIAVPWHVLAGLRNTGGANGHGFFWFYFINEHILRFLGRRQPMDYNKLPGYLFWSLHLVWLFPWSLFLPLAVLTGWRSLRTGPLRPIADADPVKPNLLNQFRNDALRRLPGRSEASPSSASSLPKTSPETFAVHTTLLLSLYTALVLIFFSVSTNQEYYTFPAYLPLLLLTAAGLARGEDTFATNTTTRDWISAAHAAFAVLGAAIAIALATGLWSSRHLPFVPDIGTVLAHRNVGDYTLSMSHFFDLTGPSFAALRVPATLAALAFALGPTLAWILRHRRRHLASTITVALTSAIFLIAAHIALARFAPMLSSQTLAADIQSLEEHGALRDDTQILLFGDQAYGSSIPFYLGRQVSLVDGRSTSMLFGSTFPDAPPIFLSPSDLRGTWGTGPRKLLFVPLERRDAVDRLLGPRKLLLAEVSGKALFTDRPLDRPVP